MLEGRRESIVSGTGLESLVAILEEEEEEAGLVGEVLGERSLRGDGAGEVDIAARTGFDGFGLRGREMLGCELEVWLEEDRFVL